MTEQTALTDFPKREFYAAAAYGKVKTISRLLPRLLGHLNNMEGEGFRIFVGGLTWAAENGQVDVMTVMLAKLNTGDQVFKAATASNENGWSAMTLAAAKGRADVMTVMLAELDTGDQVLTAATELDGIGGSALTWAAAYGRADVMMAMVRAAKEKGAEAAQIAKMFLKRDGEGKNAIERMSQETLAAVWEKSPEEVQSQLIADHRFPADKKTSVLAEDRQTLHAAFAGVAARNAVLEEKNKALEEENKALQKQVEALKAALAAAQGKPPAGNAGQGNSSGAFPKPE